VRENFSPSRRKKICGWAAVLRRPPTNFLFACVGGKFSCAAPECHSPGAGRPRHGAARAAGSRAAAAQQAAARIAKEVWHSVVLFFLWGVSFIEWAGACILS